MGLGSRCFKGKLEPVYSQSDAKSLAGTLLYLLFTRNEIEKGIYLPGMKSKRVMLHLLKQRASWSLMTVGFMQLDVSIMTYHKFVQSLHVYIHNCMILRKVSLSDIHSTTQNCAKWWTFVEWFRAGWCETAHLDATMFSTFHTTKLLVSKNYY